MERFLPFEVRHADQFVLKLLMFTAWRAAQFRPTRYRSFAHNQPAEIAEVFPKCASQNGARWTEFDADSLVASH
jgi:hypothetical protein